MHPSDVVEPEPITVRVLKYDGTEYRRWKASLAQQEDSLLVLDAKFEHDVQHQLLGEIKRGTRTIECYWLDRWYNIFRFLDEKGRTRLFYCNVNMQRWSAMMMTPGGKLTRRLMS